MLREGTYSAILLLAWCQYVLPEVEDFINSAVKQALADSTSQADHDILLDVLVRALETDASWVELYGITGELIVPNVSCPHEHLGEALKRAMEVNLFCTFPRTSD